MLVVISLITIRRDYRPAQNYNKFTLITNNTGLNERDSFLDVYGNSHECLRLRIKGSRNFKKANDAFYYISMGCGNSPSYNVHLLWLSWLHKIRSARAQGARDG